MALAWIVPRIVPSRAAMSGSTWPAIKWVFHVTASSGAHVIAKRYSGTILEQDGRDRSFRQDRAEQIERGTLGPDPVERGVPFHRHAQTLAALLDHERSFSPHVDPQHDVRDATAQLADIDLGSIRQRGPIRGDSRRRSGR